MPMCPRLFNATLSEDEIIKIHNRVNIENDYKYLDLNDLYFKMYDAVLEESLKKDRETDIIDDISDILKEE